VPRQLKDRLSRLLRVARLLAVVIALKTARFLSLTTVESYSSALRSVWWNYRRSRWGSARLGRS